MEKIEDFINGTEPNIQGQSNWTGRYTYYLRIVRQANGKFDYLYGKTSGKNTWTTSLHKTDLTGEEISTLTKKIKRTLFF
jgi:hypothetical protein